MPTEPTSDPVALMAEAAIVERDVAALGLVMARAWPNSVARVLCLAARAGAINRRAGAVNDALARAGIVRRVAPVASDLPLSVADPLWRAVLKADAPGETPP